MNDLYYYLLSIADESFKTEMSLYQQLEGDEHLFSDAMKNAYSTKKYNYLTTSYGDSNLGKALTNLFYGGKADNLDSGMTEFIKEMAHLNTQDFIKDMEVSSINIVTSVINNKLESFFQEAKFQKNLALESGDENIIETFSNVYNEKNIFDILQETKEVISEKDVVKLFPKEMQKIIAEAKASSANGSQARQAVKEGSINLSTLYNLILKNIVETIQKEITQELNSVETKDGKSIATLIKEILIDKNIVSVRSKGAQRAEGFSLAVFTIDTKKLRERLAKEIINKKNDNSEEGILKKISETDTRSALSDGAKEVLKQYNLSLQKYLVATRANSLAWSYYEKELLSSVASLAIRDWEASSKPSPASQLYEEIDKANQASISAASRSKSIETLENIEKRLSEKGQINSADEKAIEQIIEGFDKTDKDDAKMISEMQKCFSKKDIKGGIEIVRKRLVSKRAGYIANFNGSIGEIFITAILNKIGPANMEVYQKGSSKNLQGQSAHADITAGNIGIQSKVYEKNNIKLYDNTKVTFKMKDALRYLNTNTSSGDTINDSELQAFRFFLLSNTLLSDLKMDDYWTDNDFVTALNLRLANFIRYSDGLTDLGNIKNNFFIINFNIVPASVIFLKMADLFSKKDTFDQSLIQFTNNTNYVGLSNLNPKEMEPEDYLINNLLFYLEDSNALFKSFELNLNDIGADIF